MNFLKKLPIRYKGELHEVKLINFSVSLDEVLPLVPSGIKVREYGDRAIISMVNVKLKKMRPAGIPESFSFDYQHVAFRLLVDDAELNSGKAKGIYFLKSFTNNSFVVAAGNILSNYRLSKAQINDNYGFELEQGTKFLKYHLNEKAFKGTNELKSEIESIDRAYALDGDRLLKTVIQREKWPIDWVNCLGFETNFFKSAKLLGAFQVNETIDYEWLPATRL